MPEQPAERRARSRDSVANTLVVAIGVSLVCSVLVSAAAVLLQPRQQRNQTLYRQAIVLEVAGLDGSGADLASRFEAVEPRLVELATGDYVDTADPAGFDPIAAARDPARSVAVPEALDLAAINRRATRSLVYLVRDEGTVSQVILPVYGAGLWSTMYGYMSVAADGRTVLGLRFYEHAETPGLGDQIDAPAWRAQWAGKQLYDEAGEVRIEVVRGRVVAGGGERYQVDGLSGATLTGRGVTNLIRYWAGPHGFGPYLDKLANRTDSDD